MLRIGCPCVLPLLLSVCAAADLPVLHPAPANMLPSPLYQVEVDGRPLFVYPCTVGGTVKDASGAIDPDPPETTTPRPAAFCYFDSAGPVRITVRLSEAAPHGQLTSVVVRPLRHRLTPNIEGRMISFTAPAGPCQLSVEPNGSSFAPLHIFINPPEKDAPQPNDPSITHYYGPGVHEVGLLELKPNQSVYLAGGAVVQGQITAPQATGVRILGRGILDASRAPSKPGRRKPPEKPLGVYSEQIYLSDGRNIQVEGIILLDSPAWELHVRRCRDVTVRNVKIISWRENGDGIDIVASENVTVEDCFVRSWDDALVVKAYLQDPATGQDLWGGSEVDWEAVKPRVRSFPVRNLAFRRCVIWLDRAQALEIGKETAAQVISNVEFSDIDIIHGFHIAALVIQSGDRGPIENVRFRNIRLEDQRSQQLIKISYGATMWNADPHLGQRLGLIRDISFENIEVTGFLPPSLLYNGANPELEALPENGAVIDGIRIHNLSWNGKAIASESELRLERSGRRLGAVVFEK